MLNFAALGLGAYFTGPGVTSDWYVNMNKAPWTPPGWVFGAAWSTIMICFSIYLTILWDKVSDKKFLVGLYAFQLLLNISWNPVFFKFQLAGPGVIVIGLLSIVVFYFLFHYWSKLKAISLLLLPYAVWIVIATSLNVYAWLMN